MNKRLNNQQGLTLVELLASIVLISLISFFILSITTKAFENNHAITQETLLRDEADIIVSKFIKALYSTRQDHIIRNSTDSSGNSYLEVTTDLTKCQKNDTGQLLTRSACNATLQSIGFKTTNGQTIIHILEETYEVYHSNVKISPSSKINGDPTSSSVYEIVLQLQLTKSRGNKEENESKTFINEIQPIITSK